MDRFLSGLPEMPEEPEEPRFFGKGLDPFLHVICDDGPALDLIEELSWLYLRNLSRETMHSGIVKTEHLPVVDPQLYERLAAAVEAKLAQFA